MSHQRLTKAVGVRLSQQTSIIQLADGELPKISKVLLRERQNPPQNGALVRQEYLAGVTQEEWFKNRSLRK